MRRMRYGVVAAVLAGVVLCTPAVDAYAHGHHGGGHHGGTSYYYCGGHAAHTHSNGYCPYSSVDDEYYHCGGHAAHLHENGICPYADMISISSVRKAQRKLNRCGYNCGTADGVMGTKTKRALKRYQRDNDLTADGVIGQETLRALGVKI